MTSRANISPSPRAFFFSPSGNDDFDGASVERAKLSPQAAIDAAAALTPTTGNRAYAIGEKGEYTADLSLSDGIILYAPVSRFIGDLTSTGTVGIDIGELTGLITNTGQLDGLIGKENIGKQQFLNQSGNLRGELEAGADAIILTGLSETGELTPVIVKASAQVLSTETLAMVFNGATEGEFLRLETSFDFFGDDAFVMGSIPLDVILYTETFTDATDQTLTTAFQTLVSGTVTNQYRINTSYANGAMFLSNDSTKLRDIEYSITVNNAAPTEISSTAITGRQGNTNGLLPLSFTDTVDQATVEVGDTVELKVRQLVGSNVIAKGTTRPTSVTLTQNADMQNVAQILQDFSSNSSIDRNNYYRVNGGTDFNLPSAASKFNPVQPFGFVIQNNTLVDITLNTDGSDIIETHEGDDASLIIAGGSTFFILCDSASSWEIVGGYTLKRDQLLLNADSFATQNPAGTDDPLQIEFGAAQGSASDPVEIDASGNITINKTAQYNFSITIQFGRIGAGSFVLLFFRFLIDGVQFGNSRSARLDNANSNFPVQFSVPLNMTAGQVITMDITRDSEGFDAGGLIPETATLGTINPTPSASVTITRSITV